MNNEERLIATGVRVPDDATLETVGAWVERARRLAAYVRQTCPPDMPPITIEVSPLGRPAARDRSFP